MLVFRQKGDQTIIARTAKKRPDGKPYTKDQLAVQDRFLDASLYAKKSIRDDVLKARYKAKANVNQTAYNVAFKDYFNPPQIRRLRDQGYTGLVGQEITFLVKDILQVTQITLEIVDDSDTVIESGLAIDKDGDGLDWKYTTTVENPDYESTMYRFTLIDTPGNITIVIVRYGEDKSTST
ncbi:hypothetical protein [Sphingobacterium sp. UT-1RO-CII-1]|uniref:hypothetical protein n=1 Tax=Sphingobacterium sp. UT-1RO-CII-1 TaxID=2995225 RepID=UPI00227B62CC|nr:hypothetical protein [Sphingobacterium sp. UT-1RO-CII-1]